VSLPFKYKRLFPNIQCAWKLWGERMVEKYVETRDEIADFIRSSSRLLAELDFLLQLGVWRLDFGMLNWRSIDNKPSFDPAVTPAPYSYAEKNFYFNASNNLWQFSMWKSHPSISEIYYSTLLQRIKKFKSNNQGFDFNKGIVYANLGVSQSAQMKLDEGFANILNALIEDSPYSADTPEYNLKRRDLFIQFEIRYVKNYLQAIVTGLGIGGIPQPEQFLNSFLGSLNNDQRVFFDYTFARIIQNRDLWNDKENSFTANRLLAYTQDFCLFNEDFLKSKFSQTELQSRTHWELRNLIAGKFSGIDVSSCSAVEMSDLDTELPIELGRQNDKERCLRMLLMLRNYSSHNVKGGTGTNYFYSHYTEILGELVRAACYIALLPTQPP